MKLRLLLAVLALPLAAFDCGGDPPPGRDPFGLGCKLHVAGAASEDLWCIVTAYDYSEMDPLPQDQWVFELVAYRGMTEVGAGVGMFLGGRPALGTAYGWNPTARHALLTEGSATRYVGFGSETHRALSMDGTGSLSVTFSAIPPPGATGQQLVGVHGALSGTLPSTTGGAPVTISATF